MFKKIFVTLLVAVLAGSTVVGNAADTPDETFTSAQEPGLGYMGYTAYPVGAAVTGQSGLLGMKTLEGKAEEVSFCSSVDDTKCANFDFFQYQSIYPLCKTDSELDCIEAITASSVDGKALEVSNLSKFSEVSRNQYTGSASLFLPSGGVPTLFTVADAPHAKGSTYMVSVSSYGRWEKSTGQKTVVENAALAVYAVELANGIYSIDEMSDDVARYSNRLARNGNGTAGCKYTDGSKCAIALPIPTDIRFGLKVRYSSSIKGWFHGRVQDPQIQYSSGAANSKTLVVSAFPVKVPAVSVWKKKEELTSDLNYFYAKAQKPLGGSGIAAGNLKLQEGPQSGWSLMRYNNEGYTQSQMEEFLAWIPLIGDKANLLPTVWTMNLMTGYNSNSIASTCNANADQQLTGMVSTNATQYLDGPPTFNPQTDELEYKVAGPHLLPDGELSRGTYDLSLRADFARCLYGISGTAIKATISIISDNGTSVNAVSTVTERNGWLNFSAKGFTFSAPTIKVKLTSNSPAKKTAITCTKGKLSKKVTAANPKCPTGYKKAK